MDADSPDYPKRTDSAAGLFFANQSKSAYLTFYTCQIVCVGNE